MADRKRKTAKKRTTKRADAPRLATPQRTPDAPASQILDLTGAAERRPTIKFDHGDYSMLLVEELTFAQFSAQAAIGKRLIAVGDDVDKEGVLEELQVLIVEAVRMICPDMDDEAAQRVTPGQFLRISAFFNELGAAAGTTSSVPGSSDAPDASDSSEVSEAA